MKINLSKIFRYGLITLINILCIFVLQYYINLRSDISKTLSELKIAVFVNLSKENPEEDVLYKISQYNKLTNIEIINSENTDKFSDINSELNDVIPKEAIAFPTFITANGMNIKNLEELDALKAELSSLDFADDVVYDIKAYNMFFDNQLLLNKYLKIFRIVFFIIIVLFILKVTFFAMKGLHKDILTETGYGILSAVISYAIICLITVFNTDSVFMLNWQVLYILIPLSFMISLLTKESNA